MRRVSVKRRGPEMIEDFFHAEYVGMVRLAYTLVGNNAEAEEVVQGGFAEVHRRLDEIRQTTSTTVPTTSPPAEVSTAVLATIEAFLGSTDMAALGSVVTEPALAASAQRALSADADDSWWLGNSLA